MDRKPPKLDVPVLSTASVFGALLALSACAMLSCVGFRDMEALRGLPFAGAFGAAVTLLVFLVATAVGYVVICTVPRIDAALRGKDPLARLTLRWNARSIAVAALAVLACWLPWIVLQYPCGLSNDTYEQLYEFQTSSPTYYYTLGLTVPESFIDHHPVFDTLLFGAFWSIGDAVGNHGVGLFAYSLFQSALTALLLGSSCCFLSRLGVPKLLRVLSLAFVALFPTIPQYATAMLKDSLFSAAFAFFLMPHLQAFFTRGTSLRSRPQLAALALSAALCILSKKTGAVVVTASMLVLLVYCTPARKRIACTSAAVLAACALAIPACVYPLIGGVAPGGRQEAFGIPLQQVAAAARADDGLSTWERGAVESVLDLEQAKADIASSNVDHVKRLARPESSLGDYLGFCAAYLSIGVRHMPQYTHAALSVTAPLLCPGAPLGYYGTPEQELWRIEPIIENDATGELSLWLDKPAEISRISAPVQRAYKAVFASVPGALLCGIGLFGGWLPSLCIVLSLYGGKRYAFALAPVAVSALLLLLCPAAPTRYVLPFIYALPLMMGVLYHALAPRPSVRLDAATLDKADETPREGEGQNGPDGEQTSDSACHQRFHGHHRTDAHPRCDEPVRRAEP